MFYHWGTLVEFIKALTKSFKKHPQKNCKPSVAVSLLGFDLGFENITVIGDIIKSKVPNSKPLGAGFSVNLNLLQLCILS